ncbi:hypothetical protein BDR07DRAFT_147327 [Suillus spraguei]|nr:hypothetical protein BDR07DRAFT_147327 [Suillus spraguei]
MILILAIQALDGCIYIWLKLTHHTISIKFPLLRINPLSNSTNMVSDLISSWPLINSDRVNSSFAIAAVIVLTYDWALTFGQEIELIWRQRWSLMAVLYLSVRYLGIQYSIPLLDTISWILVTVWEVLALCLAVWVAIKHFEEFRQHSAGGIIGDCFRVLIETHMFYFASFAMVSSLNLIHFLSSNSSVCQFLLTSVCDHGSSFFL